MPTYALLGATGSTGSAIIRALLASPPPDLRLNTLVRSKQKLLDIFPDLQETSAFSVRIFEGSTTPSSHGDGDKSNESMDQCLEGVNVIFNCVGSNIPSAGTSLITDTVDSVIAALERHREKHGANYKPPTVIQLRSSSMNPDSPLPWIATTMSWFFFRYIYLDLGRACDRLVAASSGDEGGKSKLLDPIFIDPPAIHDAEGTMPTGFELFTGTSEGLKQEPAISYADLSAAFVGVASRREEFLGEEVIVSATGKVNLTWPPLMGYMASGLRSRIWG